MLRKVLHLAALAIGFHAGSAQALPIIGGSFETGTFAAWDVGGFRETYVGPGEDLDAYANDVFVVDSSIGVAPTHGQYQAMLTTHNTRSTNGFAESGAIITNVVPLFLTSDLALVFDWNFLTNEIPFEPMNDVENRMNDTAGVMLTNLVTGITENIVLASAKEFQGMLSPAGYLRETGYSTFSHSFAAGLYQLSFYLEDIGDLEISSALLLDNIQVQRVPEPPVMVLLLSALIAGGLVRRRVAR